MRTNARLVVKLPIVRLAGDRPCAGSPRRLSYRPSYGRSARDRTERGRAAGRGPTRCGGALQLVDLATLRAESRLFRIELGFEGLASPAARLPVLQGVRSSELPNKAKSFTSKWQLSFEVCAGGMSVKLSCKPKSTSPNLGASEATCRGGCHTPRNRLGHPQIISDFAGRSRSMPQGSFSAISYKLYTLGQVAVNWRITLQVEASFNSLSEPPCTILFRPQKPNSNSFAAVAHHRAGQLAEAERLYAR